MGWNPMTGSWDATPAADPAPARGGWLASRLAANRGGYGTSKATRLSGKHPDQQAKGYLGGSLLPAERGAEATANRRAGNYETALYDPEGTTARFADIYGVAGRAIADPAMRDFDQSMARTGANVASRFGGNVSSEELRAGYNSGDLFTRNLSEALARLGGEQVAAGQNWVGQMGGAAAQSADERDRLRALILQGISYGKPRGKNVGEVIGGAIGGIASSALGLIKK